MSKKDIKLSIASTDSSDSVTCVVASTPFGEAPETCEMMSKRDHPKKKKLLAVGPRAAFVAKNYGSMDKAEARMEKYFVFRVAGDKAELINGKDPACQSAFIFAQSISDEALAERANEFEAERDEDEDDKNDMGALDRSFGSRKRQKLQHKKAQSIISGENVGGKAALDSNLAGLLTTTNGGVALEESKYASLRQLLPPFDEEADEPSEAYPLSGFFPNEERQGAWEEAGLLVHDDDCARDFYSKFALAKFKNASTEDRKRLAAYFEVLFRFHTRVRNVVAGADEVIKSMDRFKGRRLVESLLTRFTSPQPAHLGGGWGKSDFLKHKLLITLLIVALSLEEFALTTESLELIARDLKVDAALALEPLLKKVGCKPPGSRSSNIGGGDEGEKIPKSHKNTWLLKVPLQFPEEAKRGMMRKKR